MARNASLTSASWITIASVVLEPRVENELRDVRVAIVGAGFGGLGAAVRLREAVLAAVSAHTHGAPPDDDRTLLIVTLKPVEDEGET